MSIYLTTFVYSPSIHKINSFNSLFTSKIRITYPGISIRILCFYEPNLYARTFTPAVCRSCSLRHFFIKSRRVRFQSLSKQDFSTNVTPLNCWLWSVMRSALIMLENDIYQAVIIVPCELQHIAKISSGWPWKLNFTTSYCVNYTQ